MNPKLLLSIFCLLLAAPMYSQVEAGIIAPPEYYQKSAQHKFLVVEKDGLYAVVLPGNREVLPAVFSGVSIIDSNFIAAHKPDIPNTYFFYNGSGTYLFEKKCSSVEGKGDGYCMLRDENSHVIGLIDRKGKQVLKTGAVSYVESVKDGLIIAGKFNQGWGVLNMNGKEIIPFEYTNITRIDNGQFRIAQSWVVGILDKKGKVVIPIDTQDINQCKNLYLVVNQNSKNACIVDVQGKKLLEGRYKLGIDHPRKLVYAQDSAGRFQLYNDHEIILPFSRWQPEWNIDFHQRSKAIIVRRNDSMARAGYVSAAINLKGEMIIDFSRKFTISDVGCNPNVLLVHKDSFDDFAFYNATDGSAQTKIDITWEIKCLLGGYVEAPKHNIPTRILISPEGRFIGECNFHGFKEPSTKVKELFTENIILYGETNTGLVGVTADDRLIKAITELK